MPLISLKKIDQDTWLHSGGGPSRSNGLCYYMCNYLESDAGIWNKPGTWAQAISSAQSFGAGTAMMNYAKAQNLRHAAQTPVTPDYAHVAGTLANNSIYRVAMSCVEGHPNMNGPFPLPNHEIMVITGSNNDIAFFEPNFGFFQATNDARSNKDALEFFVDQQYQASGWIARQFYYYKVRPITAGSPLSFPQ